MAHRKFLNFARFFSLLLALNANLYGSNVLALKPTNTNVARATSFAIPNSTASTILINYPGSKLTGY